MSRILARSVPSLFKTLPLMVDAQAERLRYRPLASPLNFTDMLQRRRPIRPDDSRVFELELANLGVSVRLTLSWQGQEFWVLVRQRRPDRGDHVLKFISGYVPAHELSLPLLTAVQEVAEECLLETPQGWLGGRFGETWLPTPYAGKLHYRDTPHFTLTPLSGAARPVLADTLPLLERPRAYVHVPTASLQLVYDMRLEVPEQCPSLSLFHVDERLEDGHLVARLERRRPDLYLLPLKDKRPTGELCQLHKGRLVPRPTQRIWLSESFAPQQGWLVEAEHVRWQDWLESLCL